ncbi:MAG: hypothetical protein IT440_11225, partial [Phycisphaeraceae bacterium]|nr:hypothetical protein [Phycisphaeraceae bacterium]
MPKQPNSTTSSHAAAASRFPAGPGKPEGTIKCFCCDLNWSLVEGSHQPATAQDWAFIDSKAYFDWHCELGNNVMFCQAYNFSGFAYYPTKLGPVAPGPGAELVPKLLDMARQVKMPFVSYFCVGADLVMSNHRAGWVVPGSRDIAGWGFLAPESQWTELLCSRVREFLT